MSKEETKTITYFGREYTVPVWVKYVATDEKGDIYGFKYKPRLGEEIWIGEVTHLFPIHVAAISWRDSLIGFK